MLYTLKTISSTTNIQLKITKVWLKRINISQNCMLKTSTSISLLKEKILEKTCAVN